MGLTGKEKDEVVSVEEHLGADDQVLAHLGYKCEFKRGFSLIDTICFAFSIMGVIASVSATFEFALASGGHVGMVWGWFIPSIFVMMVASSVAELASSMPTSAGLYYFSANMAPDGWGPLASWFTGWANITGQITLVCSIDYNCAQMITSVIAVASDGAINLGAGPTYGIFVGIICVHGMVCSAATKILARLNLFYVLINLGTTITAIIVLLVCSGENKVSTKDAWTLFENNSGWANNGWAFCLAFTTPMWTLTGYDSAANIAEETADAAKSTPMAILTGVGGTATLGWLVLIAASYAVTSVSALLESPLALPMAQLFLDVLGKRGMLTIWCFINFVQFVTGAAVGVDASRAVYAFSRDHALPGSKYWRQVNKRTHTPVNAVWLVMTSSVICGLVGFSEAALTSLAGATVIGLYLSYVTPVLLRITFGRKKFVPGPFSLGRWSVVVGTLACCWVIFVTFVLIFPRISNPSAQDMNYAVVIIGGIFVFAGSWWIISAHKWFKGPPINLRSRQYLQNSDASRPLENEKSRIL